MEVAQTKTVSWSTERVDWIDILSAKGIIGGAPRHILTKCLDRGGYISGGFAKQLATCVLADKKILSNPYSGSFDSNYWRYLKESSHVGRYVTQNTHSLSKIDRSWKTGVTDIDVFFQSEEGAVQAVTELNTTGQELWDWSADTLAKFGVEYLSSGKMIQLLTKFSGPPKEVIESFDIANAKVYLDAEGLHWNDTWADLELMKLLGIDRFDKPNLVWRTSKWFFKSRYVDFRRGDHEGFVNAIISLTEKAGRGELEMWGKKLHAKSISGRAKSFWHLLPARDLLKISMVYDSYDQMEAVKMLVGRG